MNEKLLKLHEIAEIKNTQVKYFDLGKLSAMTAKVNKDYAIGINIKIHSETKECEILAHELGHAITGAMYALPKGITPTKLFESLNYKKAERRANDWAYRQLYSPVMIKKCFTKKMELWEIAEEFNTDNQTMEKVIAYYRQKNLL